MKRRHFLLFFLMLPLLLAATLHKYYVSVTEIEYVEEKKSVQIISRLFVDDLETVLRKRYDAKLYLSKEGVSREVQTYVKRYLKEKFQIKINGAAANYEFIGKEYDTDIVYFYLEIKPVEAIHTFEVVNKLLFDGFEDQKNIVKTNINSHQKSFIFIPQNDKGLLNFE